MLTYDALNRLSETLDTPGTSVLYDYDHLGNLTQRGTTAIAHLSTRPHLIDTVGDNNYQYDDNGNVERRAGPDIPGNIQTLTYTPFDLPKTVVGGQTGSTRTAQFEYSADEKRIVLRETGSGLDTTRYFVADLYQRVVDNFSSSTTEERFRVYAGGREVAQIVRQDGIDTTLYFHSDNLGSTDTITTSDNDVYHQAFDPFGSEPDPLTNEVTRVGFTGHEHDRDLGLIDMKGRVYDPLSGTFTSQDPVTQAPFWSQGLNPYAYVFNNPVNNTDPSGFISISPGYPAGAVVTGSWSGFAGFGFGVGSVATKLILGGGYLGLHGMPGRTASLVTGNLAANTNPGANGMVAVGLGNPVQPPVESPGLTSDQLVEALHERFEFEVAVKREEIAAMAESELANNRDAYKVSKRNGAWAPWANKCNCFVNNVLDEVGLDPNGTRFPRPPQAGELATGSNLPADFELVPQPKDAPAKGMRGDIIAQKRNYGPGGASGHAAIMTSETSLIEASGDIGLRSNSQAGAFPANNPLAKPNSVRFVRYSPQNPWVLR